MCTCCIPWIFEFRKKDEEARHDLCLGASVGWSEKTEKPKRYFLMTTRLVLSVDDEKYPSMCQVLVFQFHDRFSTASGCGAQTEGNDSLMHLLQRHISVCNIHQQRPEEGKRHNLRQLLHHQRRCQGHAAGAPPRKERNSETKHEQGTPTRGDKTQVQDAGGRRQHITRRHPQSRVKGACCQSAVPAATA